MMFFNLLPRVTRTFSKSWATSRENYPESLELGNAVKSDVMNPSQRHRAMASNRGRTRPELKLASGLWRKGLRFLTCKGYNSLTGRHLYGSPDIVFPRKRLVLFVDGCFWHGCMKCRKHLGLKGSFWTGKISTNKKRDHNVTLKLENSGWYVIRIPEHDITNANAFKETVERLVSLLNNYNPPKRPSD